MAEIPTWLPVVAAVLRDEEGRVLLQQALPGKHHAGLWEFPGGKVESEESPRFALAREVGEELGLALDPVAMEPLGFVDQAREAGRPAIVLMLYDCRVWSGSPEGLDNQKFGWFSLEEATALPLAPLDRALLESSFR